MISKLAQVSEMAQIGEDVIVEPFSYIAGDVVIGSGGHIGREPSFWTEPASGKTARSIHRP